MGTRRVAVTGLGAVSGFGYSRSVFWDGLTAGENAFSPVASFPTEGYRSHVGAEVPAAQERSCHAFALAAAREALEQAGLKTAAGDRSRWGIALGTTSGEELALEKAMDPAVAGEEWEKTRGRAQPHFPGNIPARLARELGLGGPCLMLTTACSAGNWALAAAFDRIAAGQADLMLAGGVDVFSPVLFAGFNRLLAVAPAVCAPFSKGRQGLIPGEGCGMLVLEDWESARARGAKVLAELVGYGLSSDAVHVTAPDQKGVARAISDALTRSGLAAEEIDYVNAHGTGTPANDRTETAAIKAVFGPRAASIPVSSIKSMIGHSMGAASALEAVACVLALETGTLPPTANFTAGDPECDLDYVPGKARKTEPKVVLSNAFAFGGSNAVAAFASSGARTSGRAWPKAEAAAVTGIGLVEEADPVALAEALLPGADLSYLDKPMAYALCAVKRALDEAGFNGKAPEGAGISLDSSGELESLYRFYKDLKTDGPSGVEPRYFPNILANAAASRAAIAFGLTLFNESLGGSFPGESALARALDHFRYGHRGLILAGGVGEGACVLAVEPLSQARARGAAILAVVEDFEEGFDPAAAAPASDCFCLARALRKVAETRRPLDYRARGLWGSDIRFKLSFPA